MRSDFDLCNIHHHWLAYSRYNEYLLFILVCADECVWWDVGLVRKVGEAFLFSFFFLFNLNVAFMFSPFSPKWKLKFESLVWRSLTRSLVWSLMLTLQSICKVTSPNFPTGLNPRNDELRRLAGWLELDGLNVFLFIALFISFLQKLVHCFAWWFELNLKCGTHVTNFFRRFIQVIFVYSHFSLSFKSVLWWNL